MAKLLLVEDEEHIASGLRFNLEMEGHEVTVLGEGTAARQMLIEQRQAFDLVVLDVMIPGVNGFDLCAQLRQAGTYTPILFLTAKADDADKIRGLRLGADDYLTKPFNLDELLARVTVLLRRQRWIQAESGAPPASCLTIGRARIDLDAYEARTSEGTVTLTPLEAAVLKALLASPGKAVSREALMQAAWGFSPSLGTRTVDNFIMRLRRLCEPDPANPTHIVSVRGVGYKLIP